MLIQVRDPLLSNPKMRQALSAALNVPSIATIASGGAGTPNASMIPAPSKYHTGPHKAPHKFDLAAAKKLLGEAGYKGQPIKMITNRRYPDMYEQSVMMHGMLRQAGVNVELEVLEWGTALERYQSGKYQLMSFGYSARVDPYLVYESMLGDKEKSPRKVWDNPKAIALLQKAGEEGNPAARQKIFDEMQAMMLEDVPLVVLFNPGRLQRRASQARGLRIVVAEPRAPVGREGGAAMKMLARIATIAWLALVFAWAHADPLDQGPMTLTLQYHTAPGDRMALKDYMHVTGLKQFAGWRDQGLVKDYRIYWSRYTDSLNWDMLAVVQFATPEKMAEWRKIEARFPAGLADQCREAMHRDPHQSGRPAFLRRRALAQRRLPHHSVRLPHINRRVHQVRRRVHQAAIRRMDRREGAGELSDLPWPLPRFALLVGVDDPRVQGRGRARHAREDHREGADEAARGSGMEGDPRKQGQGKGHAAVRARGLAQVIIPGRENA
jgi:hypothetical protein